MKFYSSLILYSAFFSLQFYPLFSQKRDNNWLLQGGCSPYSQINISFTNGIADTFSVFRKFGFFITNTSISDTLGNLLFYTNGVKIGNSNHDTLLNSTDFNIGFESTINCNQLATIQEALILPKPGDSSLFYIFHEVREQFFAYGFNQESPLNLKYSILDMNLDGGLGGISPNKKGIVLINDTMANGLITACKHGNGRDWWIVAPRFWSNKYYKSLFTTDTILQLSSQIIGDSIKFATLGQANFSPDGNWYAIVDNINNLNIFKFDRCSGNFYDSIYINIPNPTPTTNDNNTVGLAFSSNSRFLYVNTLTRIYQYDLLSANVSTSQILVAEWDTAFMPTATYFLNSQLAPDNKIYIGTFGGVYILHYINSPDSMGTSCDVIQNSFQIGNNLVGNSAVPTFPNYKLGALIGSPCDTITSLINISTIALNAYPNPTNAQFEIEYSIPLQDPGELEVYDINGKIILKIHIPKSSKSQIVYFPANTNPGIYFCSIITKNTRKNIKIILFK